MKENSNKVSPSPHVCPRRRTISASNQTIQFEEIKQLFGLSERTIRRWTEQGIIQATPSAETGEYNFDFQALTQFRRVRELRSQGQSIRQIEAELQGQLNLFRGGGTAKLSRLLTPFEEALLLHEQGDAKAADSYLEAINDGDNVAEAYCNLGIFNLDRGNMGKGAGQFHALPQT